MDNKEKVLFIGKDESQIESLNKRLEEITKISYKIRRFSNNYLIIANNEIEYYIGVIVGNVIAANWYYDVKWFNAYQEEKELDKINICNLNLDKEKVWAVNMLKTPDEINQFTMGLSNALGDLEVILETPHVGMYCFSIRLSQLISEELTETNYGKLIQITSGLRSKLVEFADEYEIPEKYKKEKTTYDIMCFNFDGTLFQTDKQLEKLGNESLVDYFENSAFYLGVNFPLGLNIAPKSDEKSDYLDVATYYSSGIKYDSFIKEVDVYEALDNNNGIKFTSFGDTYFEEEYKLTNAAYQRLLDELIADAEKRNINSSAYEKLNDIPPKFEMKDNFEIEGTIKIIEEQKLIVKSNISLSRCIKNEKLTKNPTPFDALYKTSEYKILKTSFTVTDYYEIIGMDVMVHYSDSSKYFERFKIPVGFKFKDGLQNILQTRKVYDEEITDEEISLEDLINQKFN